MRMRLLGFVLGLCGSCIIVEKTTPGFFDFYSAAISSSMIHSAH
jgi:hypothetical protein